MQRSMGLGELPPSIIVRDLERRGTPRGNYKISEADDDVVIDAEAYTEGSST